MLAYQYIPHLVKDMNIIESSIEDEDVHNTLANEHDIVSAWARPFSKKNIVPNEIFDKELNCYLPVYFNCQFYH